jgi:hypothetical protein
MLNKSNSLVSLTIELFKQNTESEIFGSTFLIAGAIVGVNPLAHPSAATYPIPAVGLITFANIKKVLEAKVSNVPDVI